MKFTLGWLKEHLETEASLKDICEKLTAIGLEVESVEDKGSSLACFKIAHIVAAEKHPNADRLKLCTVDTGKENLQVVCGAPNARAGIKVVLARPGDVIPETGEALKLSKIRGVESQGMMCAADELCLGDRTDGIIELPEDAPVGGSFVEYAKLADPVIEINLTPNRADCAGVRGIARDLSAAGMGKLKPLFIAAVKGEEPCGIKVRLDFSGENKNDCSLFVGRIVRNVKNCPSPAWMQQRLRAIGLRPISALVDISNYMTMDLARPLHMFDAGKIKGALWLAPAKGGEKLLALNGKEYELKKGMTAIGDDKGVTSLAGVMGGVSSGCDENTSAVFIEAALFSPKRVAKTGRELMINSDARYRFERGVDPEFAVPAAELATRMVLDLCGTADTVVSDLVIEGRQNSEKREISYDPKRCLKRIGANVSKEEQVKILSSLGFEIGEEKDSLRVVPPSWRGDVEGADDLTEEIIRIKGFEHIPAVSLPRPQVVTSSAFDKSGWRAFSARRAMAARGLMEAVTWSFMSSAIAAEFGQNNPDLKLLNPISSDLDVMRPSIVGNLVMAAKRNADRGYPDVGLFEVGPAYRDATPEGQDLVACVVRAGKTERNWSLASRNVDVFDVKADALAVLEACGAPADSIQISADAPAWYHPGRSGSLRLGANLLGYFGELHPSLLNACDADAPMAACEIFLDAIPSSRNSGFAKALLKLDTLHPVLRDFAFVVDKEVTAEKIIKAVKGADKKLVREADVFDLYEGASVGEGKKSVAVGVVLQPTERSLTDAEIEEIAARITAAVSKATGAAIRG